ncbi:MAG TPA: heavy-metal-associated domain-containing protein [Chitinophagales bacterium]|nr:heavy-metal-associated domain-containing protein [Chitinophagales bacterium]
MNKLILSACFVLLSAACFSQTTADGKFKEVVIKTAIYCDHCSACNDCEPKIETAVNSLRGVKSAALDVETQTIKVTYNGEKTDERSIRNAIVMAGFAADGQEPNAVAYAKLDACCKKPSR